MARRRSIPSSPLGARFRTMAAAYAATGQRERAEGLVQAADAADADAAGSTTGVVNPVVETLLLLVRRLTEASESLVEAAADLKSARVDDAPMAPAEPSADGATPTPLVRLRSRAAGGREPRSGGSGETRILTAVAQHRDGVTREQLTVMTGYKKSSRDTYLQRLRAAGHVTESNQRILATADGRHALGPDFKPLPTGRKLVEHWLGNLPGGELVIFKTLVEAGVPTSREVLSHMTGYQKSSRDTYIQRLKARMLVVEVERGVIDLHPRLRPRKGKAA